MKIEVSNGEIIDKLTILQIKLDNIKDSARLINIRKEYKVLSKAAESILPKVYTLYMDLLEINKRLWAIENHIRELENDKNFGEEFVYIARSVYVANDERSVIKRKINEITGSLLIEEKLYKDYAPE